MNDAETEKENTWSDKLKRAIKPSWMAERDKQRPPGQKDWRPGHLAWVVTLGSPAEVETYFSSRKEDATAKPLGEVSEMKWQERADIQGEGKSAKAGTGIREQ